MAGELALRAVDTWSVTLRGTRGIQEASALRRNDSATLMPRSQRSRRLWLCPACRGPATRVWDLVGLRRSSWLSSLRWLQRQWLQHPKLARTRYGQRMPEPRNSCHSMPRLSYLIRKLSYSTKAMRDVLVLATRGYHENDATRSRLLPDCARDERRSIRRDVAARSDSERLR